MYSTAYSNMIYMFNKLGNKEKVYYFIEKMNKNIPDIEKFTNHYMPNKNVIKK